MDNISIDERLSTGLFTVQEACRLLAISNTALYEFMKSGAIDYVKLGRCRRIPGPAIRKLMQGDGKVSPKKKRGKAA